MKHKLQRQQPTPFAIANIRQYIQITTKHKPHAQKTSRGNMNPNPLADREKALENQWIRDKEQVPKSSAPLIPLPRSSLSPLVHIAPDYQ